jgi:hypothetical protein
VTDKGAGPTLCPSAPASPGAALVGVLEENGRIANLPKPLPIDAEFIDAAKERGPPEQRFRFTAPCQQGRCVHWTGQECGLIGQLHRSALEAGLALADRSLPRCAIRPRCRWWIQDGPAACAICPLIVTELPDVSRKHADP